MLLIVWIITVGHWLKSEQYGSMVTHTAPGRTYGHLPLLASDSLECACFLIAQADSGLQCGDVSSSSLVSTHLAYDIHCSVLWLVVAAPLQVAILAVHQLAMMLLASINNLCVHISHCCCLPIARTPKSGAADKDDNYKTAVLVIGIARCQGFMAVN